jgi:hypothetical protein
MSEINVYGASRTVEKLRLYGEILDSMNGDGDRAYAVLKAPDGHIYARFVQEATNYWCLKDSSGTKICSGKLSVCADRALQVFW